MAALQKRNWTKRTTTCVVRWATPDEHEHSKSGYRTRKAAQAFATEVEHRLQRAASSSTRRRPRSRSALRLKRGSTAAPTSKPRTFDGYRYTFGTVSAAPSRHAGVGALTRCQFPTFVWMLFHACATSSVGNDAQLGPIVPRHRFFSRGYVIDGNGAGTCDPGADSPRMGRLPMSPVMEGSAATNKNRRSPTSMSKGSGDGHAQQR